MTRRTQRVLLIGGLAIVAVVATVVVLTVALARIMDPNGYCETGFSPLITCTLRLTTITTRQSSPIFPTPSSSTTTPSSPGDTFKPSSEVTSWAIAQCPSNYIAKRLLCAAPSVAAPAQAATDDIATGLPRPKPWVLTTAKNSPFIESVHLETPLDLAAVLGFYRVALSKRGWTENGAAVVAPDRAVIAFTTADGPALLRLTHEDDRTVADLSLRKSAAANTRILPRPGQVRLMLGNDADEDAVLSINGQAIELAAGAGRDVTTTIETARKSPDNREIDLPPGKYKVTLKVASGAAQTRELEVAADETWALLVGPAGVPLPLRLY
jgi:hypothetical protein